MGKGTKIDNQRNNLCKEMGEEEENDDGEADKILIGCVVEIKSVAGGGRRVGPALSSLPSLSLLSLLSCGAASVYSHQAPPPFDSFLFFL